MNTSIGRQVPLGSERLKTCELFAEILHLQYLYTSSPLFERLIITSNATTPKAESSSEEANQEDSQDKANVGQQQTEASDVKETTVAEELILITDKFIDAKILPVCLVCNSAKIPMLFS